jgi:hypothetical protein
LQQATRRTSGSAADLLPRQPRVLQIIEKENTTQTGLKELVGDRLEQRPDLRSILKESRRCWNLNYAEHFHMDVLPSLPNIERKPTGILLTDTDLVRWQKSNPIAYADWFRERMRVVFEQGRIDLAKALKADVAEVPEWQVKTPLQRVVQLLKRHRDIYFAEDQEHKPISIIITTLAAQAYGNQPDLHDGLVAVLDGMASFIERKNGRYIVSNPVEPDENFADKWNEKPALPVAFFKWLERAHLDFVSAVQGKTLNEAAVALSSVVGTGTMGAVAKSLGIPLNTVIPVPVRAPVIVPDLGTATHRQLPPWPERLAGKVRVQGGVYLGNQRGKELWDLSDRPVPRTASIKFTASSNVREPYEVKWQVVNTGKEATDNKDLRGGFYENAAGTMRTRWEHTRYSGTHWVEAFVIKDGVCVARSGKVLVKVR